MESKDEKESKNLDPKNGVRVDELKNFEDFDKFMRDPSKYLVL